jgi:hypothetical protein
MAWRFDYRRVKIHRADEIAELADLLGVQGKAIGRWIAAGLRITDKRRPFLTHGAGFRSLITAHKPVRQRPQPARLPGSLALCSILAAHASPRWAFA